MASLGIVSAVGGPLRTGRGGVLEQLYPHRRHALSRLLRRPADRRARRGGRADSPPAWSTAWRWRAGGHRLARGRDAGAARPIKRGYLGISSQPVRSARSASAAGSDQESGLLIVRVEPDSPAAQGGLLLGDMLSASTARRSPTPTTCRPCCTGDRVGKAVPVEVIRGGARSRRKCNVGERGLGCCTGRCPGPAPPEKV